MNTAVIDSFRKMLDLLALSGISGDITASVYAVKGLEKEVEQVSQMLLPIVKDLATFYKEVNGVVKTGTMVQRSAGAAVFKVSIHAGKTEVYSLRVMNEKLIKNLVFMLALSGVK